MSLVDVCNAVISYAKKTAFVVSATPTNVEIFVFLIISFARMKCSRKAVKIFWNVDGQPDDLQ